MKKVLIIALLSLICLFSFGQNGGPIKFLGIPIDGTEAQFTTKLKSKGFTYNPRYESYSGQFNGSTVNVYIHTNHNLVDRVYVSFPPTNEDGIRVEFNRLLAQFNNTGKYLNLSMNEEIPETDDISYEITVNNKRYQASFTYIDTDRDPVVFTNALIDKFSDFFSEEDLAKLKEYIKKSVDAPDDQREALQAEMLAEMQSMGLAPGENDDPEKALEFLALFLDGMKSLADGDVWFMIHENYGRYNIGLYYDNLHNQAHGEDL